MNIRPPNYRSGGASASVAYVVHQHQYDLPRCKGEKVLIKPYNTVVGKILEYRVFQKNIYCQNLNGPALRLHDCTFDTISDFNCVRFCGRSGALIMLRPFKL